MPGRFAVARDGVRLGLGLWVRAMRAGRLPQISVGERLAMVAVADAPVQRPVRIAWSDRQIPFIDAECDGDLAVALGVVHAHLRMAQIEMMRRIATGRLAEVLGAPAAGLDHALRTIGFVEAGRTCLAAMSPEGRDWVERFLSGLNHQIASQTAIPRDLALIDAPPKPWRLEELMAVMRLASTDFTWKVWLRLIKLRGRPDWPTSWARLIGSDALPEPSLGGLGAVFDRFGRPGSNAYALAGARTASGKPLMGGDPHLGIQLPNLWIAVGLRSPSYHAVGLMVPAVPMLAPGRNRHIAWGGTNLHAASSELVRLKGRTDAAVRARRDQIGVRWGRTRDVEVRESAFGPVISDVDLLGIDEPLALHWMGRRPSDEVTALLDVAGARDWDSFRAALSSYAVPGLTLVYADAAGRIGRVTAATLPRRPPTPPVDIVSEADALDHWRETVGPDALPQAVDPPEGVIASANDEPPPGAIVIGRFFSPPDRVARLRQLLGAAEGADVPFLARLQLDVAAHSALQVRDRLAPHLPPKPSVSAAVADWDGRYDENSAGALGFELIAGNIVQRLPMPATRAIYAASWHALGLLDRELARLAPEALSGIVVAATRRSEWLFRYYKTWGAIHRLRLGHPLMRLPLVGRRYRVGDFPVGGSNETLMKSRHGFVRGRHSVGFGAQARHIFDLSDMDANHLVLLGGQDGWLGSTTFADHLPLWRKGELIRVPMRAETVRAEHPHVTVLTPPTQRA
ncbi:penicillin acylase family protein [Silicimonas algicola]|uniref:Penicillin amidase n=1 Tax=Silicimonas algicola TaxID=1826607 RepID=A0A316FWI4_9RHOB|nr:penicillin acylase family protein [Silicimonas algicola]PWK53174.1 penicillin amidase [Silicimonas algicola]